MVDSFRFFFFLFFFRQFSKIEEIQRSNFADLFVVRAVCQSFWSRRFFHFFLVVFKFEAAVFFLKHSKKENSFLVRHCTHSSSEPAPLVPY